MRWFDKRQSKGSSAFQMMSSHLRVFHPQMGGLSILVILIFTTATEANPLITTASAPKKPAGSSLVNAGLSCASKRAPPPPPPPPSLSNTAAVHALGLNESQAAALGGQEASSTPAPDCLVTHFSSILQAYLTISLTQDAVLVQMAPPANLASLFSAKQPLSENFSLPSGAGSLSPPLVVDHVQLHFNPKGTLPFPQGQIDPAVLSSSSAVPTCFTCYLFVSFIFTSAHEVSANTSLCDPGSNFFCPAPTASAGGQASSNAGSLAFLDPAGIYLPATFSAAAGTLYAKAPILSPYTTAKLRSYNCVTPLASPSLGKLWVSHVAPPAVYAYGGSATVGPVNYYMTNNGRVLGVGQVLSTTYLSLYASFFTQNTYELNSAINSGNFDVPKNFTVEGLFPTEAVSTVTGHLGQTTFTLGFSNFKPVVSDIKSAAARTISTALPVLFIVSALFIVV